MRGVCNSLGIIALNNQNVFLSFPRLQTLEVRSIFQLECHIVIKTQAHIGWKSKIFQNR